MQYQTKLHIHVCSVCFSYSTIRGHCPSTLKSGGEGSCPPPPPPHPLDSPPLFVTACLALMKDQVASLEKKGLRAVCLHGQVNPQLALIT